MKLLNAAILFVFIIILGLGLSNLYTYEYFLKREIPEQQRAWANSLISSLAETLASNTINENMHVARDTLVNIVQRNPDLVYAYLVDFDGSIFAHTFNGELPQDLTEGLNTSEKASNTSREVIVNNQALNEYAYPLIDGMPAAIHIGISRNKEDHLLASIRKNIFLFLFAAGVVAVLLGALFARRISRPFAQLAEQMHHYANTGEKNQESDTGKGLRESLELEDAFSFLVSEREKARDDMLQKSRQLEMILKSTGEAIYGIDHKGRCTFANPACIRSLGYQHHNELLGMDMHYMIHHQHEDGSDHPVEECPIYGVLKSAVPKHVEHDIFWRKDNSYIPVDYHAYPIIDNDQVLGAVVSFVDITDRLTKEQELNKYRAQLEELVEERTWELHQAQSELVRKERLATLGQLTATVSHELRNPLAAMKPSLFIIEKKTASTDDEKIQSSCERIKRNIDRCDQIIDELLDFTRITNLKLEDCDLDQAIDEILKEQRIPEQLVIERIYSNKKQKVQMDHGRFRRAFINVFENACHALLKPGSQANGEYKESAHMQIKTACESGRCTITVTDNGYGMTKETLDKIFEPLFSTKGFGVGLGMPTVKQILEQHGGGIDIISEAGRGTTVTLWLPATE